MNLLLFSFILSEAKNLKPDSKLCLTILRPHKSGFIGTPQNDIANR